MHVRHAWVLSACLLLAGCATSPDKGPAPDGQADAGSDRLTGRVLSELLDPIAGARVSLAGLADAQTTAADGGFDFGPLEEAFYVLRVQAHGFRTVNLTVTPVQLGTPLQILLPTGPPVEPYAQTWPFRGVLECALELAIITPSCDSILTDGLGLPGLFEANQTFWFEATEAWQTIVADVVFDPRDAPGLDGLRLVLRGTRDAQGGGEYEQYGRWHAPESFTVRVEPGQRYDEGVEPVPKGPTWFEIDVYPQSHGRHLVGNLMGAGVATDVRFEVFVTVFYVDQAPQGYSFALGGP